VGTCAFSPKRNRRPSLRQSPGSQVPISDDDKPNRSSMRKNGRGMSEQSSGWAHTTCVSHLFGHKTRVGNGRTLFHWLVPCPTSCIYHNAIKPIMSAQQSLQTTPPESFTSLPPTPPATREKTATSASRIIAEIIRRRDGNSLSAAKPSLA
jgi:hypothetical protein